MARENMRIAIIGQQEFDARKHPLRKFAQARGKVGGAGVTPETVLGN